MEETLSKLSEEDRKKWADGTDREAWLHTALNRGFFWPELVRIAAVDSNALEDNISLSDFIEYCDKLAGPHAKPDYKKGDV